MSDRQHSSSFTDVLIQEERGIGQIILNRPRALNALSLEMVKVIKKALYNWQDDPSIKMVMIEGEGDKAFCAGGDIRNLYETGRKQPELGRSFWREEYQLNAFIDNYKKPFIALMDGITMGGGVGLSSHGSHRIVTERTTFALPETAIGFLPDCGTSFLLSKAPGKIGLYLGCTGTRIKAADVIFAGFADYYIESKNLEKFRRLLKEGNDLDKTIEACAGVIPHSFLAEKQEKISQGFGASSLNECIHEIFRMVEGNDEWAKDVLKKLKKCSPLSLCATFYALEQAKHFKALEQSLTLEYRFAHRSLEGNDFYEGVRAMIIDKDNAPIWSPEKVEETTPELAEALFKSLGEDEWHIV